MYKILINGTQSAKGYYTYYKTSSGDCDWSTDNLTEVAKVYKTLLQKYPANRLSVIQTMEMNIKITVLDIDENGIIVGDSEALVEDMDTKNVDKDINNQETGE